MAPTHSGATAPVRAQGPARYSVLEQGLCQVQAQGCGLGWGLPRTSRGSSRQAGAGRHNQVRVVGWTGILKQDSGDAEKAGRR